MTQHLDLEDVRRGVYRAANQDGLGEIFTGLGLMMYGAVCDAVVGGAVRPGLVVGFILFGVLGGGLVEIVRNRHTVPRTGYVRMLDKPTLLVVLTVLVPMIAFPAVGTLARRLGWFDLGPLLGWAAPGAGVVLACFHLDFLRKSGRGMHVWLASAALLSGLGALALAPRPPAVAFVLTFVLNGALLASWGVVMLACFTRRHPRAEGAGSDDR